jgi:hypothetical protein
MIVSLRREPIHLTNQIWISATTNLQQDVEQIAKKSIRRG